MKSMELWQGDCLELMKNIPDRSVDLVLTDPPYGISYQSHRGKKYTQKLRETNLLTGWTNILLNVYV